MLYTGSASNDDDAYTKVIDENTTKVSDFAIAKTEYKEDTRKSKPFFPITPYLDDDARKALH